MKRLLILCLLAAWVTGPTCGAADVQPPPQPLIPTISQPASPVATEVQAAARARAILAQQYNAAPNGWPLLNRIGGPWRLGNWAAPEVSRRPIHLTFSERTLYDGLAWFVHFRPAVRPEPPIPPMFIDSFRSRAVQSANREGLASQEDFILVIGDQGQRLTTIIRID